MECSESQANLRFFTTSEIADMLKMNSQVIARKLQKGELLGYKIGKDWRVSESDLLAWLKKHSNRARQSDSEIVIERFVRRGRIVSLPAQRKKRRYLLEYILGRFESNRVYTEKEVNDIISRFYDDFCTVRREFICEKMMSRIAGKYRRNSSYKFISSRVPET
jgi:excisionase family DNA binding protein